MSRPAMRPKPRTVGGKPVTDPIKLAFLDLAEICETRGISPRIASAVCLHWAAFLHEGTDAAFVASALEMRTLVRESGEGFPTREESAPGLSPEVRP